MNAIQERALDCAITSLGDAFVAEDAAIAEFVMGVRAALHGTTNISEVLAIRSVVVQTIKQSPRLREWISSGTETKLQRSRELRVWGKLSVQPKLDDTISSRDRGTIVGALADLTALLAKPVTPIYDANGILIGAQRK